MSGEHIDLAVINRAKDDKVKLVQLQFTDINGSVKAVTIPIEKFPESLEKGLWFDGSSIEGFTRICESDMFLKPDAGTYALLPWETVAVTARLFCDVYMPDGSPFEGDPRYILKRAIKNARDMNFEYNVGPELEFFLFKPKNDGAVAPTPHDVGSYFDFSPRDLAGNVRADIIFTLEKMGINVEMSHHEVAPGQHEIDFKYAEALRTAENALTFKQVVKSIAHKHDLYATFMPKPIFGICGSGMHCHQSLFDIRTNTNIFFDENDTYKLSRNAKHFIAGQLEHVRAMSAILSPTVNSYKRLVPGYEAPVNLAYSKANRSAAIRIPMYSDNPKAKRVEFRCPDGTANPYLAFSAMLMAGIDGIINKIDPGEAMEMDIYHLSSKELKNIPQAPDNLESALEHLANDNEYLKQGGVFTDDLIETWIEYKMEKEVKPMALRPHPYEFHLYYEV